MLAGPIGKDCLEGSKYEGKPRGSIVPIAGIQTYFSHPPLPDRDPRKVILFFSDVNGPFYENNFMLQDYFASQGFHVLGIDYFFGDPVYNHTEPRFDRKKWMRKSRKQAEESVPKWTVAVRKDFGKNAKYFGIGYCFGGPYALEVAATNNVSAAAFAHPAGLTEDHFKNAKQPLLLSCAENDDMFPASSRRRAVDILSAKNATYMVQLFSGVKHGFATRGDPADANAAWAKEESARSVVGWFQRFSV